MRRRHAGAACVLAAAVIGAPSVVRADSAAPTDFRSEVVSITPAVDTINAFIEGGDAFVHLEVTSGTDVVVLGYAGEPYLWFATDGTVSENRRSYAVYYNDRRDGSTVIPEIVDNAATPEWRTVGHDGTWSWHDHRTHWMGADPPVGMRPGDELPAAVVPVLVDGDPVEIVVVSHLVATPSPWSGAIGAVLGVGSMAATWALWRRRRWPATPLLVVAMAAVVIAVAQTRSMSASAGRPLTWWLPPVIAAVSGLVWSVGDAGQRGLLRWGAGAIGAAQLTMWAFGRRAGLTRGVLPTDAPFWLDRLVTAAAGVFGVALLVWIVSDLVRSTSRSGAA